MADDPDVAEVAKMHAACQVVVADGVKKEAMHIIKMYFDRSARGIEELTKGIPSDTEYPDDQIAQRVNVLLEPYNLTCHLSYGSAYIKSKEASD